MKPDVAPPPAQRWRNAGFWLISNLLGRFIGFVRSLLVARFLGPDAAGFGYLAVSIGNGARALLELGSGRVIITNPEVTPRLIASAFWIEVAKGLLLALILLGFSLYAWWGGSDVDPLVPALAALLPLALGGMNPMLSVTEREGRHGRVAAFQTAGPAVGAVLLAILLAMGQGWISLPIAIASGQLVTVVLSHVLIERMQRLRAGAAEVALLLRKGTSFLAMGFGRYLGGLGLDAVLAAMGALQWVAPLRVSIALVQTVLQGIPAVLGRSSLSQDAALSRVSGQSDVVPVHLETMMFIATATAGLAAGSFLALPALALLLYGEAWNSTVMVIPALCAAMAVRAVSAPFGIALIASRRYAAEARITVVEHALGSLLVGVSAAEDIRLGIWGMGAISVLALGWRATIMIGRSVHGTWSALSVAASALGAFGLSAGMGTVVLNGTQAPIAPYLVGAVAVAAGSGMAYVAAVAVRSRASRR